MLVHDLLERSAARAPEAPALIEIDRTTTFGELAAQADAFARLLVARGVRVGDRVVLALDNSADLVACYFGTMKAGACVVPLAAGPRSDRLAKAVLDCSPVACVTDRATLDEPSLAGVIRGLRLVLVRPGRGPRTDLPEGAEWLPDALESTQGAALGPIAIADRDLAVIIYTSGSTGEPRGVILQHANIVANTASIVEYLALTANDRVMCVLPFYYVYGLSLLHTHISVGGAVIIDNRFAFPNTVIDAMLRHRATGFAGVPSSFALLLHRSKLATTPLPDLRYVTQAGGGMAPARVQEWLAKGPRVPFFVMYGATEASARLTYLPPADLERKLGSIGRAIPGVEMLVLKEDGAPCAPGEVGELVARGPNISPGYWKAPDETALRFTERGYLTGDLGYADDEGFLFLVGRRHDMLKVGAHRISAKEIEDVLQEHPDVHEAAVIGVPHEMLGEAPVAFVAINEGLSFDAEALRRHCQLRLPVHKVPERVLQVADLPKTPAGKIDKPALRARASSIS